MNNPAPSWLAILRPALEEEYADRPRIATLATVDAQHHPRARTVILRQIDNDGTLWITSSAHADKNKQLGQSPLAELVLYLPATRQQFRLAGKTRVIGRGDDALRLQFWRALSDAARATFFWPTIGQPVNDYDAIVTTVPQATPMPESFELISIRPDQVEHLTVAAIPHQRTRWREQTDWIPLRINP